jgi:hypothetical protein
MHFIPHGDVSCGDQLLYLSMGCERDGRSLQACVNSDIKARNPVAEQKIWMCVGIWRALSHMSGDSCMARSLVDGDVGRPFLFVYRIVTTQGGSIPSFGTLRDSL